MGALRRDIDMSETEHIKNLLIKSLENSKRAETDNMYVAPRLGIKGAAIQIMDSFIEVVSEINSEEKLDKLIAQYIMYADGSESIFTINDISVDPLPPQPVGDFFEAVPDLLISVIASTKSPAGLSPGRSDAIYAHDADNEDDLGEIDVYISLPEGQEEIMNYLDSSRLELCGILTHEMQHVVQKMVCGYQLNSNADQDIIEHAFDQYEIDARIEESITLMGDDEDEQDEVLFVESLNTCIDQYLARNTTSEIATQLKERMIKEHIEAYKLKMNELI